MLCECCVCYEYFCSFPCFCRTCDPLTCEKCIRFYLSNKIKAAIIGTCPRISCPQTCNQSIPFRKWSMFCSNDDIDTYINLSSSLLSIQCGGCHKKLTLYIPNQIDSNIPKEFLKESLPNNNIEDLLIDIQLYEDYIITYEELYFKLITNYQIIHKNQDHYHHYKNPNNKNTLIITNILSIIHDPERKVNLHLRYLRDFPCIQTKCCDLIHCFRCQTMMTTMTLTNHENGKSCVEIQLLLDNCIINCPSCGIALVKGDGCDIITCVCGHDFNWEEEKLKLNQAVLFSQSYPYDTHVNCARILCTSTESCESSTFKYAQAWYKSNKPLAKRGLLAWWKESYVRFPSQVCALYLIKCPLNTTNVLVVINEKDGGVNSHSKYYYQYYYHKTALLWAKEHEREVYICLENMKLSQYSLFCTLFNNNKDRVIFSSYILNQYNSRQFHSINGIKKYFDPLLSDQLVYGSILWSKNQENQEIIKEYNMLKEWNHMLQFLQLYGHQKPKKTYNSIKLSFKSEKQFDIKISDSTLIYSNNNQTCHRPLRNSTSNPTSTYPCALVSIISYVSSLTCVLEECPLEGNWLTFGLARRNHMGCNGNWGFGRTSGSWGIADHRSSPPTCQPNENGILGDNGQVLEMEMGEEDRCTDNNNNNNNNDYSSSSTKWSNRDSGSRRRKLQQGDILRMECNLKEGWVDLFIINSNTSYDDTTSNDNDNDNNLLLIHRFQLPPCNSSSNGNCNGKDVSVVHCASMSSSYCCCCRDPSDYVFGVSLANGHTIRILNEQEEDEIRSLSSSSSIHSYRSSLQRISRVWKPSSANHDMLYKAYLTQLKRILQPEYSVSSTIVQDISNMADVWFNKCDNDVMKCVHTTDHYLNTNACIVDILLLSHNHIDNDHDSNTPIYKCNNHNDRSYINNDNDNDNENLEMNSDYIEIYNSKLINFSSIIELLCWKSINKEHYKEYVKTNKKENANKHIDYNTLLKWIITDQVEVQGLNSTSLESYLSPKEFENIFHMRSDEFYKLQEWKQYELKKQYKLIYTVRKL